MIEFVRTLNAEATAFLLTMTPVFDKLAGCVWLILAMALGSLWIFTAPTREHWTNLPIWVRLPMLPSCAFCLARGVDLMNLANQVPPLPGGGHANLLGLLGISSIAWLVTTFLAWVLLQTWPIRTWRRALGVLAEVADDPEGVAENRKIPVVVPFGTLKRELEEGGFYIKDPAVEPTLAVDDATVDAPKRYLGRAAV